MGLNRRLHTECMMLVLTIIVLLLLLLINQNIARGPTYRSAASQQDSSPVNVVDVSANGYFDNQWHWSNRDVGSVINKRAKTRGRSYAADLQFWTNVRQMGLAENEVLALAYAYTALKRAAVLRTRLNSPAESKFTLISLLPEVLCPHLVRVGSVGDGGKWLCSPWRVPSGASIYSLGSNQDISFELEIQAITLGKSRIHTFDKGAASANVLRTLNSIGGTYDKAFIEPNGTNSLASFLKKYNETSIEILKIDVEGSELPILSAFLPTNPVCHVLVEVHNQMLHTLKKLSEWGYFLYHYEPNTLSPPLSEFSFIHRNCVSHYGALPLAPFLSFV